MKGAVACRACSGALVAKKGSLKVHHFAHKTMCTAWASSTEPMTAWHAGWQELCLPEYVEVPVDATVDGQPVRCIADVRSPSGTVIELQHSTISSTEMLKREEVHDDMIWIVDARTPRTCASQECHERSCNGRHVPVTLLLADRLIAQVAPPSTLEYAVFEIEIRGLSFPFASHCQVYFDTPQGLFLLLRRLGRRVFLGSKVDRVRFFEIYFAEIGTCSTSELAKRYDARCEASDPHGVSFAQMKEWGLHQSPETETWILRPPKQPAPTQEAAPETECRRADAVLGPHSDPCFDLEIYSKLPPCAHEEAAETKSETLRCELELNEWWGSQVDRGDAKRAKRKVNKEGCRLAQQFALDVIKDKVACLNQDREYLQRARQSRKKSRR